MNITALMGRLTADPELKTTQSGVSYCRFSIAVDRQYKNGQERLTDFFNCVAWRSCAEFITKYFVKGQMIAVTGSLQTGSYENRDGVKINTVDVLVSQVSFCGSKKEESSDEQTSQRRSRNHQKSADISVLDDDELDDLPF